MPVFWHRVFFSCFLGSTLQRLCAVEIRCGSALVVLGLSAVGKCYSGTRLFSFTCRSHRGESVCLGVDQCTWCMIDALFPVMRQRDLSVYAGIFLENSGSGVVTGPSTTVDRGVCFASTLSRDERFDLVSANVGYHPAEHVRRKPEWLRIRTRRCYLPKFVVGPKICSEGGRLA